MRIDAFSQLIVPLIFLLVWAITSVLNRDSRPLPPRPNRPGGPGSGAGSLRDALTSAQAEDSTPAVVDGASSPRSPLRSPGRLAPPRSGPPDGATGDDDVRYIAPPRRAGGEAPRPSTPRKPARGRRAEPPPARSHREQPETQRVLSEQVGQAMALNRGQSLKLPPISANLSNLNSASLRDASSIAAVVRPRVPPPALSAADVQRMMADGARLREMAVLVELLQPPVSRRPRRLG